jgi:hypothetical protein
MPTLIVTRCTPDNYPHKAAECEDAKYHKKMPANILLQALSDHREITANPLPE